MIQWKKLKSTEYEGITSKFDFYVQKSGGDWALIVFDHKIKDTNEAFIEMIDVNSLADGKEEAENYIEYNRPTITR